MLLAWMMLALGCSSDRPVQVQVATAGKSDAAAAGLEQLDVADESADLGADSGALDADVLPSADADTSDAGVSANADEADADVPPSADADAAQACGACDDGNPCTDDGCDPAAGCVHSPNTNPCDDGNPCTLGDACAAGACKSTGMTDCADGVLCTTDTCDIDLGCVHTANANPCDDGNVCTLGDACLGGMCKATALLNCDDGNACTDDSCDMAKGCVHAANPSACGASADACVGLPLACTDDGDPCTLDVCKPAQGCVHTSCPFLANVTSAGCTAQGCSIGTCSLLHADCNAEAADGCETDTGANLQACGGCGQVCPSVAHGSGACKAGTCTIVKCETGFGDCNGSALDGCETDFGVDPKHCGGCATACKLAFSDYVGCGAGACTIGACSAGHVDCDGVAANGCEAMTGACDSVPPAPITTLSAETGLQVELTWQAVGGNGNVGTATRYVIKYSTQPITDDAAFDAAAEFPQALTPTAAGMKDTIQVQGLKPRETYYFVVRAVDKAGNLGLFTTYASAIAGSFGFVTGVCCDGSASWGDADGDGDLDLLIGWTVQRNDGGGVFSQSNVYYSSSYGGGAWLDLDRDGLLDVVAESSVYRNQGDGTFLKTVDAWPGKAVAWADVDNDGDADAVAGDQFVRNDGAGVFSGTTIMAFSKWTSLITAQWADLNRDGNVDLVVALSDDGWCKDGNPVQAWYNQGPGGGELAFFLVQTWKWSPIEVLACADEDADGHVDILAGVGKYCGSGSYLLHNYAGFQSAWQSPVPDEWFNGVAWGDYDGDGDFDFLGVASGYNPSPPAGQSLYRNAGGSKFSHEWSALFGGGKAVAWADYDGDGDLDYAAGGGIYRSYEADFYGGNPPPGPPTNGFAAAFDASQRTLTVQFGSGSDADPDGKGPLGATPALGLYYDIAIGTAPGKGDIVSPAYGSPLLGNHGQMWIAPGKHGFVLHDPPAGNVYWRVHCIDAGLAAGPWSTEQSVFVTASSQGGWPSKIAAADTTGEKPHELQYLDTTGPSPKAFVPDDGWTTVLPSVTLAVTGFQPPWKSGTLAGLKLQVTWSTGSNYNGTTPVHWGHAGDPLLPTGIVPQAGQSHVTGTFDLFAAGVKGKAQLADLVIEFTNGSGSGMNREMSVDGVRIDAMVAP